MGCWTTVTSSCMFLTGSRQKSMLNPVRSSSTWVDAASLSFFLSFFTFLFLSFFLFFSFPFPFYSFLFCQCFSFNSGRFVRSPSSLPDLDSSPPSPRAPHRLPHSRPPQHHQSGDLGRPRPPGRTSPHLARNATATCRPLVRHYTAIDSYSRMSQNKQE